MTLPQYLDVGGGDEVKLFIDRVKGVKIPSNSQLCLGARLISCVSLLLKTRKYGLGQISFST